MSALPNPVIKPNMKARLLRIGEPLPFDTGFPYLDPVWTWIVEDNGNIMAVLISAPGPGIAILLRIMSLPSSPLSVIVALLRKSLTDMHKRGYHAYLVCLDKDRPLEAKLARIAIKSGGLVLAKGTLISGKTDIGRL